MRATSKRRNLLLLALALALALPSAGGHAATHKGDRRTARQLGMNLAHNRIQFHDRQTWARFVARWDAADRDGLRVLHLGDSHVQNGIIAASMRAHFKRRLGDGGPGLLFPYSTARTYSPRTYRTRHTGTWTYGKAYILPAKLPFGVAGMSSRTEDPEATFSLRFRRRVPRHWRKLRLYCKRSAASFDLSIESGGKRTEVTVGAAAAGAAQHIDVELPAVGRTLVFRLVQRDATQTEFVFYGMSLQSTRPGGLVVHSAGVGGARFRGVLAAAHFEEQLPSLQPDLVIIDFGTNDYLYTDQIEPQLEVDIRATIQRVRAAVPEATIVLTTAGDLYRRKVNLVSGEPFADLVHRVAQAEGCGVWDWYWIAGGRQTLPRWRDAGLARRDLIHLTRDGYAFKGRWLARAIAASVRWYREHPDALGLQLDRAPLKRAQRN